MSSPLGVIAGKGDLPCLAVTEAKASGREVLVITFDRESKSALDGLADNALLFGLGQAGKVIDAMKKAGVTEVAFAGKIDKRVLFENPRFDMKALSILKNLSLRNDDAIMLAIVAELEKEGFMIVSQAGLLKNLMPGPGRLGKREPSADEWADIRFGMEMAKGVARLDIGQTVVVKNGAVVAVEAIEGTDEAIERGGTIAKKGAVVCKVSKPGQDPRFDVPTVGRKTIETMLKVKAGVLAIEANETLVPRMDEVVGLCDRNGISFVAV